MKPVKNNDPALSKLLREWKSDAQLPPRFQEQVWERIALEESVGASPIAIFWSWLTKSAVRPSFAVSYATILVLVGLATGLWQAHIKSDRAEQTLSTRYVQMVDPYQMPR